jgi:hypothetical protein
MDGLGWGILILITAGIALPVCLFFVGRRLINSIEISDGPPEF